MSNRGKTAYILSHGFAARMVIQTELLAKLARRGRKVSVICPDASDSNLVTALAPIGASIHEFDAPKNFFTLDYRFIRNYFVDDVRANPTLWSKHLQAVSRKSRLLHRCRAHALYAIHKLNKILPLPRWYYTWREKSLLRSSAAEELLKTIDPDVLVATYPMTLSESMLLSAARKLGIRTVIHLLSWDNITAKGVFPVLADEYIAWGPIMKEELQEYYSVPDDAIHVCGVPHFDLHRSEDEVANFARLRELGLTPDQPFLFVAMSAPYFAPNALEIIERLAKWVESGEFGPQLQIVIRPHPQNVTGKMADKEWLPVLDRLQSDRVKIDYPSVVESKLPWSMESDDMLRLTALIQQCAVCINFGSTVAIDALTADRPVVTIAFDGDRDYPWHDSSRRAVDYTHFRKLVDAGGGVVANSYDELKSQVAAYAADPSRDADRRRNAILRECLATDGRSTERCANAIEAIFDRIGLPATCESIPALSV